VSLLGYASEALATDGPIGRSGSGESDDDDPIAVLKQRYAAGEIGSSIADSTGRRRSAPWLVGP
jgi:hypothetical protein